MRHARTAVLAVVAWLASCTSAPMKDTERAGGPEPPAPSAPVADAGAKEITFAAVGDIMLGTDYPENILPDDDGVSFLASVAPMLSAADVAFGNLEGVLMDGGEPVKQCKPAAKRKEAAAPVRGGGRALGPDGPSTTTGSPTTGGDSAASDASAAGGASGSDTPDSAAAPSSDAEGSEHSPGEASATAAAQADSRASASATPRSLDPSANPPPSGGSCFVFRSPTRYANHLRDAGFDVVSLANNHAQDFGDAGRASSMQALDAVGIHHSGREGDVAEWTAQGLRFALVAFAPNIGSHQLNDLVRAQEIVTELAARNDIVVVSFHGGAEGDGASRLPFAREIYAGEDRGDVVEFAHTVIDAGADLVIGHGPHVMRAVELYRDRLIAYSLGNFATYYGISVNGVRGISGVLTAKLAGDGRFLDAKFASTVQIRPGGPQPDPERRALIQLRELTDEAFPDGALAFSDEGVISRQAR